MTDSRYEALEAVWEPARAAGSLGSVSIEELREHAAGYISPSLRLQPGARCVDLGTGVGIPGVMLAMLYPETTWYLLDGSARRCEIARRAVRAAGLGDRVEVVHERADDFARELSGERRSIWSSLDCLALLRSWRNVDSRCLLKMVRWWCRCRQLPLTFG